MTVPVVQPVVQPVGLHAALVSVDSAAAALALSLWLRERVQALDIVPAATTVLVDGCAPADVAAIVHHWDGAVDVVEGPLVEIPVVYDGPDLPRVAEVAGLTVGAVVAAHAAVEHVVAFGGFSPGFGYLAGSPWDMPRLASPRARVPAGSVALAGTWTGIYPSASPGGWQLIGRTDAVVWDPARESPALLAPGTRVRFVPVGHAGDSGDSGDAGDSGDRG